MHLVFLANEGTSAVGVMAVAMAVAFLMVVGLGAYVLYCDAQNRAGEAVLAGEGHGVAAESAHAHDAEPVAPVAAAEVAPPAPEPPSRRHRPRPPRGQ
jgi:hypothetical protein